MYRDLFYLSNKYCQYLFLANALDLCKGIANKKHSIRGNHDRSHMRIKTSAFRRSSICQFISKYAYRRSLKYTRAIYELYKSSSICNNNLPANVSYTQTIAGLVLLSRQSLPTHVKSFPHSVLAQAQVSVTVKIPAEK